LHVRRNNRNELFQIPLFPQNPSLFKSPSAALEALTTHLTNGRSIVIDAAHATVPSRLVYREALVHLSQTSGIRPFFKCIYFECVPEVVKHNSVYRALYGREEERKAVVELTVLREFERRFQPPSFREGKTSLDRTPPLSRSLY